MDLTKKAARLARTRIRKEHLLGTLYGASTQRAIIYSVRDTLQNNKGIVNPRDFLERISPHVSRNDISTAYTRFVRDIRIVGNEFGIQHASLIDLIKYAAQGRPEWSLSQQIEVGFANGQAGFSAGSTVLYMREQEAIQYASTLIKTVVPVLRVEVERPKERGKISAELEAGLPLPEPHFGLFNPGEEPPEFSSK